jgi:hypothetical protein
MPPAVEHLRTGLPAKIQRALSEELGQSVVDFGPRFQLRNGGLVRNDDSVAWANEIRIGMLEPETVVLASQIDVRLETDIVSPGDRGKALSSLNHVDVHFDSSFVKPITSEAESAVRIPARMNGHFRDQHRSESVFTFDPKWLLMMGGRRAEPRRDQPRAVTPIDCRRISRTAFRFR